MKIIRHHFESLNSTNLWAKEHAASFERNQLTLVTADHQSGGQGRLGRHWLSPAGKNIYATYCFFVDPLRKDIGNIPQIMAIAAANLLEEQGFAPKLKWPNDLILNNKKVAGILTETQSFEDLLFVAVGIGINVNMLAEDMASLERPATSLLIESNQPFEIEKLLRSLNEMFHMKLQLFLNEGFAPFLAPYQERLIHTIQHEMAFRDSQSTWEGDFAGSIPMDRSLCGLKTVKSKILSPANLYKIFTKFYEVGQ